MPERNKLARFMNQRQYGFSLLEMMIAVAVLSIVLAVVVDGVSQLSKMNLAQNNNVDLTQESRQFIDQIVQDLHHAGFPNYYRLFAGSGTTYASCQAAATAACGLINVTSTSLQFEGDVDGSGQVSEVFVQLNTPCPCTITRGTVYKTTYITGGTPNYYIQLNNVVATAPFTAFDVSGNQLTLPCTASAGCSDGSHTVIGNIKAIAITLPMQSSVPSSTDNSYQTITMTADAKINN